MGKICGLRYSSVRYNEDEEEEYYFDELEDWLTEDEVEALTADCPYEIYPEDDDEEDDEEDDEMRELRIAWMKNYIQVIEEQNDGSLHI